MRTGWSFCTLLLAVFYSGLTAQVKTNSFASNQQHFKMAIHVTQTDYLAKTIIFKVKSNYRSICQANTIQNPALNVVLAQFGAENLSKIFPHHLAPELERNKNGQLLVDLSLIYKFNYTQDIQLEKAINKLIALQLFDYVEPFYIQKACYVPNDPDISQQYHLNMIQAYNAWSVNSTTSKGDTNVVIGILDTGTEPTHSDLKDNIKHNYADPINGIDDDGDGYIDNFSGWDLGENDNNPTWDASEHGVHTSGIASATTDNNNGIAGVGFKCKFLPVKISDASGVLTKSYEGIIYAADHGCAIINCSWGGVGGGEFGQSVVNYATFNKNALVVAAAGNDGVEEEFYPGSFENVLSVASTTGTDDKSNFSNYSVDVGVCAPGSNIYSTWGGNTYAIQSGTSMSCPVAAGAAAIVKSVFPNYTAIQIKERLKATCDNIYAVGSNASYTGKLGNGRINLYNALTQTTGPSIIMSNINITDHNDNVFIAGDTLRISGDFTNYLSPSSNLSASISSSSPYVSVLNGSVFLGSIATLGKTNNSANPFTVKILPGVPVNSTVQFKISFSDGAYAASQYFNININTDYINVDINDVGTTVTSIARLGYNMDGQTEGLGFTYKGGASLLYEGGLMIGISPTQVSDAIRGVNTALDEDFFVTSSVARVLPAVYSDFDLVGSFNDSYATSPLNIDVNHKAFAWTASGYSKFVILQYNIKNNGSGSLSNLYAGLFADWDIDSITYNSNRIGFDAANKMGYTFYTGTNGIYAGIKLLSNTAPVVHYAIDNVSGGAGGVDLITGPYDKSKKFTTLSTNRNVAGATGNGNDVIDVLSSGPFNLNPGSTAVVGFALIIGDNLADLQTSAANAQQKYDGIVGISSPDYNDQYTLAQNIPNPAADHTLLEFNIPESSAIELKIYNMVGQEMANVVSDFLPAGKHQYLVDVKGYNNGMYYYCLNSKFGRFTKKMIVLR